MFIPIAILMYRFFKKYPVVVVVLLFGFFSKLHTVNMSKEIDELEVECLMDLFSVEITSNRNKNSEDFKTHAHAQLEFDLKHGIEKKTLVYILTAYLKLYILFNCMSIDERKSFSIV